MRRISLPLLLLVLLAACTRGGSLEAGKQAPDFRADDLTGQTRFLNAEIKRPVVLTFFATWCAPCREEIPLLIELTESLGDQAQVLCVDVDPENVDKLRSIVSGLKINYPVLLDEGAAIKKAYGVEELPVTFVIDTRGMIRSRFGPIGETEAKALAAEVRRLVNEK